VTEFPLVGRAMAGMGEQLQAERAKVAALEERVREITAEWESCLDRDRAHLPAMQDMQALYRETTARAERAEQSLNQVQDERAASFERLAAAVGGVGLTPYQAEIDIAIEARIRSLGEVRDNLRRTIRAALPLVTEAVGTRALPPAIEQRLVEWATRPHPFKDPDQRRRAERLQQQDA
jgi:hypothetical protein